MVTAFNFYERGRRGAPDPVPWSRMSAAAEEGKTIYRICSAWDTATDEERRTAKTFVGRFIRYPFKMACVPSDSEDECPVPFVEIYVQSDSRGKVTDWLEIQESGAIGVIFDEYRDPERPEVLRVSDACDDFNDAAGVEFVEHVDSDEEAAPKVGGAGGAAADDESE